MKLSELIDSLSRFAANTRPDVLFTSSGNAVEIRHATLTGACVLEDIPACKHSLTIHLGVV